MRRSTHIDSISDDDTTLDKQQVMYSIVSIWRDLF